MPVTKSAERALRKSGRRRIENVARKENLKAVVKQFKKLVTTNKEEAQKFLSQAYKKFDKLAKVKVIKKNRAARMKSKLAKLIR
jgi:small subunit ribosomal protein S20